MPATWEKLPFEVLICIFEYIDSLDDSVRSKIQLNACQLVCKGWSKAAQAILYKDIKVYPPKESLTDNCPEQRRRFQAFVQTLVKSPHLGALVRTITTCTGLHIVIAHDHLKVLELIFSVCYKMEGFYAADDSIDIVWSYMLSEKESRLSNIKSFFKDEYTAPNPSLYSSVATKLKKSLTNLQVDVDTLSMPLRHEEWAYSYLVEELPTFVSLKNLCFTACRFRSYKDICRVIDKCNPATVNKLTFHTYIPFTFAKESSLDEEAILPNYSVKEIYIRRAIFHSAKYFTKKFKNLEKLTVERLDYFVLERKHQWFQNLTSLCMSLKDFELCYNLAREEEISEGAIELISKMTCDEKQLYIEFNVADTRKNSQEDPPWGIKLKKKDNNNACGIEVYLPEGDYDYKYHTIWLEKYFPTQIRMKHIQNFDDLFIQYERSYLSNATLLQTKSSNFINNFKSFFSLSVEAVSIHKGNWAIFQNVILSTANTQQPKVYLNGMIICNMSDLQQAEDHQATVPKSSSIKELRFEDSIFHHQILPLFSLQLPKIDTLIFDACCIMMDTDYTLKIFLPQTKLRRLGLVIAPPSYADNLLHDEKYAFIKYHLKNAVLVESIMHFSPQKSYTVKIETEMRTYIKTYTSGSLKLVKHNKEKQQQQQDVCHGTKNSFLIWIKCLDLNELSIVHDKYQMRYERVEQQ